MPSDPVVQAYLRVVAERWQCPVQELEAQYLNPDKPWMEKGLRAHTDFQWFSMGYAAAEAQEQRRRVQELEAQRAECECGYAVLVPGSVVVQDGPEPLCRDCRRFHKPGDCQERREAERGLSRLACNLCQKPLAEHVWGYAGPGPVDGLSCPSEQVLAALARLDSGRGVDNDE